MFNRRQTKYRTRTSCSRALILIAASLAVSGTVYAALGSWSSVGPEGASVNAIAVDPTNPTIAYAATLGGGIYKTIDSGASWSPSNNGLLVPGMPGEQLLWDFNVVAVDPGNPATVFAAGSAYLYRSGDAGATWSFVNSFPTSMSGPIRVITIDAGTPTRIYVGADRRIVRSIDGGATWVTPISFSTARVTAIEVDPTNRDVVYAARRGSGSLKSTNGGSNWTALNINAYDLTIDPAHPETLYVGLYGSGVYKSIDSGTTWIPFNVGLDLRVRTVAVDPAVPTTVYAGTDAGIFKSIDGAVSWAASSAGLTTSFVETLTTVPGKPGTIYAGGMGAGVFKSTDSAATWTPRNSGLVATRVEALATSANTLFSGIYGFGVSRRNLSGGGWTTSAAGLAFPLFNDVAVAPSNPSILFVAAFGGLFKSIDGGTNWAAKNPAGYVVADSVAVHPIDPSIVYAASHADLHTTVFKSVDGGETWNPASSGLPAPVQNVFFNVPELTIDPIAPDVVYAGTNQGVFKTVTGGTSWFPLPNGGPTNETKVIVIDSSAAQTVYALSRDDLYKTINGGSEWSLIHTLSFASSLAITSSPPGILYFGSNGFGVRRSKDGGMTWQPIDAGLTNRQVTSLAVGPVNSKRVFAGIAGGGVFELEEPSPTAFYTVIPCRVIDTRNADGPLGGPALGAGTTRTFGLSGQCEIPATAKAVSANVTVTGSSAAGHLTIWPADGNFPFTSAVNYGSGKTRANNAILSLSAAGEVSVYSAQTTGGVHLILDVTGYFQ